MRPSTIYNFTGFCLNGNNTISNSSTVYINTKSNGGKFLIVSFSFTSKILKDMAKRLACYLSWYLKVPARL